MAVRGTMSDLIGNVRTMIGDPSGGGQVFTDQAIQDVLDANREPQRYLILSGLFSYLPGGQAALFEFEARDVFGQIMRNWENDTTLVDAQFNALTPSAREDVNGHWTTASSQLNGVMATGKVYDVNAAAYQLLMMWIGIVKLAEYDMNVDGNDLKRSQKIKTLSDLAKQYGDSGRSGMVIMRRNDVC